MKYISSLLLMSLIFISSLNYANAGESDKMSEKQNSGENIKEAVFAGGCFWCIEKPYEQVDGVISATSGYIGGHTKNPTYKDVSGGRSGHYEAINVVYDSSKISYKELLEIFWVNIDPHDAYGQFCDKGQQYSSAIFYGNDSEKKLAEESIEYLTKERNLKGKIYTQLIKTSKFYDAEDYHQDYYKKNPVRYKFYRYRCGRDSRLDDIWGSNRKY